MAYDLLIKGGRIYDGSGLPSYLGDVAVQDGRVVETGRISGSAKRVIKADGLAVSPGFIDFHTHLDAQLLWDPLATSSCFHGVTTVIPGNCALALAPCKQQDRETILRSFERVEAISLPALKAGVQWSWTTFPEYLNRLRGNLGVNVAALMGHCALRQFVMGEASTERAATPGEIHQMKEILKAGVRAGAIGFSTNQNPVHMFADGTPIPSRLATDEEIIELACALGEINRGAVQISRGSLGVSVPMRETVQLFERIASTSGRPVIWQSIAHRWDRPNEWRELLDLAQQSLGRGVQSYPLCNARLFNNRLTLKNAQVFDDLPTWKTILFLPLDERIKAFRDPEARRKLRYEAVEEKKSSRFSRRWDLVYMINAATAANKHFETKSVAEIAKIRGQDVIDAFLDLSLEEGLDTEFQTSSTNGDEEAVAEIIRSPFVLVGQSDAGAHLIYDAGFGYATRLLGYWIREKNIMSLEEGVRKLTFMVASIFGLQDRGLLRPAMAADLVVFDPATIRERAAEMVQDLPGNEKRLIQKAVGIETTIVNGQVLVERGEHTGAKGAKRRGDRPVAPTTMIKGDCCSCITVHAVLSA
ncbi:MAG: amidohydrolase family protein [Deltaproteobacteria bacterium]|nr:amidohydrolase family protein [Deltaproteobacteria bacterium]